MASIRQVIENLEIVAAQFPGKELEVCVLLDNVIGTNIQDMYFDTKKVLYTLQ